MTLWYPHADNTTQNFQNTKNRPPNDGNHLIVLHTTETQINSWPGYNSGGTAPNLTVQPTSLQARGHYPVDHAGMALVDPSTTAVRENREGCQIEIVATCDERRRGDSHFTYVGDFSDAFYEWLAEFCAWYKANFPDFEIASSVTWKPLMSGQVGGSYGLNNGVRLSSSQFDNYKGILGHQHVPGNSHGDPGVIDVAKIIAMATGVVIPPSTTPPPVVSPPPVIPPPTVEPYDIDLNGDVWVGLLKFGTTDSDSVRRMQKVLNGISLPPPGNVTIPLKPGTYGPMTDDVVRTWQLSIGDAPDTKGASSVGPLQAAKLFAGTPCTLHAGVPGDSGSTGSSGGSTGGTVSKVFADRLQDGVTDSDSVRAVQRALNGVSFPPYRNIEVNGNYDQVTKDMVAAFQRSIGNNGDGYLGPKQTAKLFEMAGMPLEWHSEPSGGGTGSAGGGGASPPPATTGASVSTPYPGAVATTPYGKKGNWAAGYHTGVDYACGVGTPLRATWTGTVVAHNAWGAAYGKHVIYQATIDGQATQIAYCHMSRIDAPVGSATRPGSHLGMSGNTGNTTGPHVHIEFRRAPYRYNNKCVPPQM